jgi:hypothetical protein
MTFLLLMGNCPMINFRFNNCPDGWALSTLSNNTCYLVISEKDNWQNSENKCLAQSTSLASIDSAFENNQING